MLGLEIVTNVWEVQTQATSKTLCFLFTMLTMTWSSLICVLTARLLSLCPHIMRQNVMQKTKTSNIRIKLNCAKVTLPGIHGVLTLTCVQLMISVPYPMLPSVSKYSCQIYTEQNTPHTRLHGKVVLMCKVFNNFVWIFNIYLQCSRWNVKRLMLGHKLLYDILDESRVKLEVLPFILSQR